MPEDSTLLTPEEAGRQADQIWNELDREESAPPPEDTPAKDEAQSTAPAEQATAPVAAADAPAEPAAVAPVSESRPPLEEKIAALEQINSRQADRLRAVEGRIGGLMSQLSQALANPKGAKAPPKESGDDPNALLDELVRDYPEFATPLSKMLKAREAEIEGAVNAKIAELAQQQQAQQQALEKQRRELPVDLAHPGWQERVATPEFNAWLDRQAPDVKALAESAKPQDAIKLLDLAYPRAKPADDTKQRRLEAAARLPTGNAGSSIKAKPFEEMTDPAEIWAYLDAKERAEQRARR
jgi:hypothetical protein